MSKIVFDIAAKYEAAEWADSHLLVEISHPGFSYAVVNKARKVLQLRCYELDARDNEAMAHELAAIFRTDTLLQTAPAGQTFVYNFPESQLVPEKYFDSAIGRDFIELFHGDLNKGIVLSERIEGDRKYNVYRVPGEIHSLLQRSFSNGKYWHYYSLWMLSEQKKRTMPPAGLSVLFYPSRLLVSAVKNDELQLLQSFVYEAAEDAAYYLLNICGQLDLPPETTPIMLSGMIDVASALYAEIYKYFGQVILESPDEPCSIEGLEEYPSHFFSPLLKLAACVS